VTKNESKTAQAVADLPDDTFQAVKAGTISKKAAIRQNRSGNGDKPPKPHYRQGEIAVLYDNGLTNPEIAAKTGLSTATVFEILHDEKVKRSAQAHIGLRCFADKGKLELAIRQHKEAHSRVAGAVNAR
jgi:DNA-binding NarL/FixJ family response regulator